MADTYTRLSNITAAKIKSILNTDKILAQLTDDQKNDFLSVAQQYVGTLRNKLLKETYLVETSPVAVVYNPNNYRLKGTTAQRPAGLGEADTGFMYFDTDVGSAIWWNGTAWQ